ncbi:MAG TPA: hypothetical protein VL968_08030, partial [Rhodocyclaceae bacterium]|nr:hypothetical protein [Rhodocyclaceae bacterium]
AYTYRLFQFLKSTKQGFFCFVSFAASAAEERDYRAISSPVNTFGKYFLHCFFTALTSNERCICRVLCDQILRCHRGILNMRKKFSDQPSAAQKNG